MKLHEGSLTALEASESCLQAYLADTADKLGILPHITFNTRVRELEWLEAEARWRTVTEAGAEILSHVVIHAAGMLHHPATPRLGGEAAFRGETVHTARWDNSIDFSNKVIYVIWW